VETEFGRLGRTRCFHVRGRGRTMSEKELFGVLLAVVAALMALTTVVLAI
jgi:hypothetical protein